MMILKTIILKNVIKKATDEGSLIKLPEPGSTMKFKNLKNMMERPSVIISDLESTLLKRETVKSNKKR